MIATPERYSDVRAEYREGYRRGWNGHAVEYPISRLPIDEFGVQRHRAWEAGVRKGRKDRQRELRTRDEGGAS